jgi:CubicO group peptidase (beta-lactamase class C family)
VTHLTLRDRTSVDVLTMRLNFPAVALLAALLCASCASAAAQAASRQPSTGKPSAAGRTFAELQRAVRQRVDTHNSTGIVAAVLGADGQTRVFAYGRAAGGTRVTVGSVFEIGSITKVFTGTLLADMVQRGEVALDDPVASLLPAGVTVPSRNGREITLVDLATHTSGLPREATNLAPKDPAQPYADYTVDQLYDFLAHATLASDPGSEHLYSNVGAGLLGHALALRAGRSYEQLVRERVLDPLGMRTTAITLTPALLQRMVAGHDLFGLPAAALELPTLAGAGALRSTAGDMLKFAAANLSGSGDGVLDRAMAVARTPRRSAGDGDRIGLHWITSPVHGGRDIVWHNGGTLGQHSFLGLDPVRRTAVIVLSGSVAGIEDIGVHALDPHVPLQRPPKAVSVPARTLARYVGRYSFPGFRLRITRTRGGLLAHQDGAPPVRLAPESPTRFFLNMAVRLRFTVRGGRATRAVLSLDGLEQTGRRAG